MMEVSNSASSRLRLYPNDADGSMFAVAYVPAIPPPPVTSAEKSIPSGVIATVPDPERVTFTSSSQYGEVPLSTTMVVSNRSIVSEYPPSVSSVHFQYSAQRSSTVPTQSGTSRASICFVSV